MSEHHSRRAELLARVRDDRRRIERDLAPLAGVLGYADRGLAIVHWVRERPVLLAAAVAAGTALSLVGRRRRSPLNLVKLALSAWQSWRFVSGALGAYRQRRGPLVTPRRNAPLSN